MVCCRASANCVIVLSSAVVMVVVFEFPCVTAFVIRLSAAEMSDTGAEWALDALEGAIGGGGNRIENKEVVQNDLGGALAARYSSFVVKYWD